MRLFNALCKEKDSGFSLLEITIVILIIAILGAIVSPSFINLYNVNKVNEAIDKTKGAIQEAQNQAIRYGRRCQIRVINKAQTTKYGTPAEHPTIESVAPTSTPSATAPKEESCLLNGDRTLPGIALAGHTTPWIISFDFKGRTSDVANNGTLILSIPDTPKPQKCLVISQGLGMVRTGDYEGTNCNTSR
ncbi:prepilin-type N-terminal cleavage/methylation domain-containing protein [Merismopedia glauca]|uniref:Prepilin-type cleavage/methylation domain-containing protein n=1 Tax=Merismopedia glauca CCAP 1448/3 TaxID=1296344 RepID=A0A2T1C338_9CYAN|nr:prepilin-type N-terminal cleavage/methylation domain-containing protein [Merismopedia glauca]PSB02533.1 hypothetical protein C7B64_12785 [Merismopedia glauca CCAP 1448/3]